ncbi:cupin domain-containing protein [Pseudonocardia sp.]|uniref:cupin domain-containing protein n=1 Tax=Pseudonocardia sp. TaxID=60912 RepID=UPI00261CB071|nr:cupin domain-containing protein [Pseudonocardia sp.]
MQGFEAAGEAPGFTDVHPADATGTARGHGSALRRATGVDAGTFATEHWGRAPLLTRGADRAAFRDLLDLDGVDELLSRRGLRTPFLRLARHGAVLDSGSFTGPGGAGAEVGDQVREDRVAALFADGTTVVLQALHRLWPPLIDFATRLGSELGHPVQVNAYVTPPSSQGFSAHYDVHDVFVLQLAGRKHWTVHAPVHPDPLRDQPWSDHATAVAARARDDDPVIDTVLGPGDALYLPRGWLHAATALGGVCAHLTVGVHVVTGYALVQALTALVADDPALRASLPLGLDIADPEALGPHVDAVRDALVAAVARIPAERVARRVRQRVWDGTRPEPVRPVAGASFAAGLAAGDVVRRRLGLGHRVVARGDRVLLELADREIALPATTAPALHVLLDGDPHAVGSLPDMDEADQLVLIRRLLREGVLVP